MNVRIEPHVCHRYTYLGFVRRWHRSATAWRGGTATGHKRGLTWTCDGAHRALARAADQLRAGAA